MAGGPRIAMERATLPQLRKSVTKKATGTGDDVRMKFECFKCQCRQPGIPFKVEYLKGTFFKTLSGDRKKIFLARYLFAYDLGLVKEMG
ncbi:hypothetical protein Y032_0008g2 [Ancylostoma ceylanicum]|uniref:Uncharacterized protein n=1 Tax=Ancylostoma ceylanicum TaxID=53326 RepID=A0A016VLA7_9BILA|nr:hypothetical protein Y032_0008g2 [Ancylostoma ceylanicum]